MTVAVTGAMFSNCDIPALGCGYTAQEVYYVASGASVFDRPALTGMPDIPSDRGFILAYGASHGGKSLLWYVSELLFAYFLTEACGLPPRQMGLILGASLLLNGASDLFGGRILDHWLRTPADAGRLQVVGAILAGATFAAFGLAGLVPASGRFAFALSSIVLFRLTYTLLDLPQNALLALTTGDDAARGRLSSLRYIFAGVAGVVVSGAIAPLLRRSDATTGPVIFAVFSAVLAACAAGSAIWLWRYLRRRTPPRLTTLAPRADGAEPDAAPSPRRWPIFLIMFVISITLSVFARLEPYFISFGLKSSLDGGALMIGGTVASLACQPFWAWLVRRRSLLSVLRVATIGLAASALAFGLAVRLGPAPAALCGLAWGWTCGGVLMSLWALAASSARSADGSRGAASTFGLLTFSTKVALALSAFWIGEFLARGDYRTDAGGRLLGLMTASPMVGAAISLALSAFIRPTGAGRRERPVLALRQEPTCP